MTMLKSVRKAASLIVMTGFLAGVAQAEDLAKRIEVPAGDLLAAIEALQQQSDVQVVYRDEELRGIKTTGVSGTLTTQEAVRKLLEGTSLKIRTDASGAMMIVGANML